MCEPEGSTQAATGGGDAHFWADRAEIKKKNKVLSICLLAAAHDSFRDTKRGTLVDFLDIRLVQWNMLVLSSSPHPQDERELRECPSVKMDRTKQHKCQGGAEKLRDKSRKSLQVNEVKCAKITHMFAATSSTATTGSLTSAAVPGAKAGARVAPSCKTDNVVDSEEEEKKEDHPGTNSSVRSSTWMPSEEGLFM